MGDITKNFSFYEFDSKDGTPMSDEVMTNLRSLCDNLQSLRDHLGVPIDVTENGGYRSVKHNRAVGGVKKSQHILGNAADIKVSGYAPHEIKSIIEDFIDSGIMEQGGIGLYNTFVHYDIRGYKARWKG